MWDHKRPPTQDAIRDALRTLSPTFKVYGIKQQRLLFGANLFGRLSVSRCPLYSGLWVRWAVGHNNVCERRYHTTFVSIEDLQATLAVYWYVITVDTARSQLLVRSGGGIERNTTVFDGFAAKY